MRAMLVGVLLSLVLGTQAFAQARPAPVRGTVVSLEGNVLTVKGPAATQTVLLNDGYTVSYMIKSDFSKVGPGTYIGAAAVPQPDGTFRALAVTIFNDVVKPPEGQRAWDLAPGSMMTNAVVSTVAATTVDKVDGRIVLIKFKDGEQKVFVGPTTPIVTYAAGDKSALLPGANVIILGVTRRDDGTLAASNVSVGKDGLVPPM